MGANQPPLRMPVGSVGRKMNLDFKAIARLAREEEEAREKEALAREPVALGMNGACHVVAMILKEIYPHYHNVGRIRNGLPEHVGCKVGEKFIDIEGVHPLPVGVQDCEPITAENQLFRGSFMKPRFLGPARSILEPYLRTNIERYPC